MAPSRSRIDVMLQAGLDVPHSYREGHCGTCVATVFSGQMELAGLDLLTQEDLADGLILGCQARPVSDHVHMSSEHRFVHSPGPNRLAGSRSG